MIQPRFYLDVSCHRRVILLVLLLTWSIHASSQSPSTSPEGSGSDSESPSTTSEGSITTITASSTSTSESPSTTSEGSITTITTSSTSTSESPSTTSEGSITTITASPTSTSDSPSTTLLESTTTMTPLPTSTANSVSTTLVESTTTITPSPTSTANSPSTTLLESTTTMTPSPTSTANSSSTTPEESTTTITPSPTSTATPAAVKNLTSSAVNRTVTLQWQAGDGDTDYYIIQCDPSCDQGTNETQTNATSYVFNDMTWGKLYKFSVTAMSNNVSSGPVFSQLAIPPAAVNNLTSFAVNRTVTLQWQAGDGDTEYYLIQCDPSCVQGSNKIPTNVTLYVFSNMTWGKLYKISVIAMSNKMSSGPERSQCAIPPNLDGINKELQKNISDTAKSSKTSISFIMAEHVSSLFDMEPEAITGYSVLVVLNDHADRVRQHGEISMELPIQYYKTAKELDFSVPYVAIRKDKIQIDKARRRHSASLSIDIGTEENCVADLCNGPLDDNENYCVYFRGYTEGGSYIDTECVVIRETVLDEEPVVIGVVVPLVASALVAVLLFVYRRFSRLKYLRKSHEEIPMQESAFRKFSDQSISSTPKPIKLEQFVQHVEQMHGDQGFRFTKEYQTIKELSPSNAQLAAVLSPNTPKNRYTDILPYDHSRVKLLPADEDEGSDYINASYMPGYTSKREFIAAQGPLPGTIDHFWRMIWEQNVTVIVMLTQCMEKGRRKCESYWPEHLEEANTYGDISVLKRNESVLPDFTIRVFDVQLGEIIRTVKQFFISFWPDFGCPEKTSSLLNLVRVVRSHTRLENHGPILVHCSAGVGRTGTYIAIDHLLQRIQEHDEIDVFGTVLRMREHRCKMVQTEDQYVYIHDCLKDALLQGFSTRYTPPARSGPAVTTTEDIEPTYENFGAYASTNQNMETGDLAGVHGSDGSSQA